MARKYSKAASKKVEKAMHERKAGSLKSGRSGKTVKSRKQAIAIGLSEARRAGRRSRRKGHPISRFNPATGGPANIRRCHQPPAGLQGEIQDDQATHGPDER